MLHFQMFSKSLPFFFISDVFIFEVHHIQGGNFHQENCCCCRLSKNDCLSFVRVAFSSGVWEVAGCEIVRLNIQEHSLGGRDA